MRWLGLWCRPSRSEAGGGVSASSAGSASVVVVGLRGFLSKTARQEATLVMNLTPLMDIGASFRSSFSFEIE